MENKTKKICLIVDDSRVVRKVTCRIVKDIGLDFYEAENGMEAYEYCLNAMPDVVLLDWNMPVMGGIEFTEKLRRAPKGMMPKVVFCTTENKKSSLERALKAGADEYIMKPFDREIIESKFKLVGIL